MGNDGESIKGMKHNNPISWFSIFALAYFLVRGMQTYDLFYVVVAILIFLAFAWYNMN